MLEHGMISHKAMKILSVIYEEHQAVLWVARFMIIVVKKSNAVICKHCLLWACLTLQIDETGWRQIIGGEADLWAPPVWNVKRQRRCCFATLPCVPAVTSLFATLSLNLMETFSCLCRATGQDWLSYCAMAIKSTVCENKTKVLVQTADNTSDISW